MPPDPAPIAPIPIGSNLMAVLSGWENLAIPIKPNQKAPLLDGWQMPGTMSRDEAVKHDAARRGTGFRCGLPINNETDTVLYGIDIDIDDAELVARVEKWMVAQLDAEALPRRVGQPPRVLLPIRVSGAEGRAVKPFVLKGGAGKIEILGKGRQFIVAGTHVKTGLPYTREPDFLHGGPDEIPCIDHVEFETFLKKLGEWLATEGLIEARKKRITKIEAMQGPAPIDTLASALAAIPCSGLAYDDWIATGMALKASVRDDAEGLKLWSWWSTGFEGNTEDIIAEKWRSFKPDGRIGAGSIFRMASLNGWTMPEGMQKRDTAGIRFNKKGLAPDDANMLAALTEAIAVGLIKPIRRNSFSYTDETETAAGVWTEFNDMHYNDARMALCKKYQCEIPRENLWTAIDVLARANSINPQAEWLRSLQWDGLPRLDTWLTQTTGCEDTELHRAYSRKFLAAAVARIMRAEGDPGVKFDSCLTLIGGQGIGKSTLFRKLAGGMGFTDSFSVGMDSRETIELTRGVVMAEDAELGGMKREHEHVKHSISKITDSARMAWGRKNTTLHRRFVLCATTNIEEILLDTTGNRRIWAVKCGDKPIDLDWLDQNREQFWAEAVVAWETGETLYLPRELEIATEKIKTSKFMATSAWDKPITEWLVSAMRKSALKPDHVSPYVAMTTMSDVMRGIGIPIAQHDNRATRIGIGRTLAKLGGVKYRPTAGGMRVWHVAWTAEAWQECLSYLGVSSDGEV